MGLYLIEGSHPSQTILDLLFYDYFPLFLLFSFLRLLTKWITPIIHSDLHSNWFLGSFSYESKHHTQVTLWCEIVIQSSYVSIKVWTHGIWLITHGFQKHAIIGWSYWFIVDNGWGPGAEDNKIIWFDGFFYSDSR